MGARSVDALAEVMRSSGLRHFFAVTGGAAINIVDALVETAGLIPIFHHHEQAAALAAEAYARKHGLGLCVVTTGPGVTNALTGVLTAWQDSIPLIVVSGQARRANSGEGFRLRQAGTQHLSVEILVQSIVKRFISLRNPTKIHEDVLDLVRLAREPRKGPVWLDFPLDVQLAKVGSIPVSTQKMVSEVRKINVAVVDRFWSKLGRHLARSERPVLVLGRGASELSLEDLNSLHEKLVMPVVTTWGAVNSAAEMHASHIGRIGVSGQRGANKVVHESDLVLGIGARFCQSVTGASVQSFAPQARVFSVDVDPEENKYLAHIREVETLAAEASTFVSLGAGRNLPVLDRFSWSKFCQNQKFSFSDEYGSNAAESSAVDLYQMMKVVDDVSAEFGEDVVVDGGGTVVYGSMQVMSSAMSRKILIPAASAPMGTGIPHGIGVALGHESPQVWVLIGDGSLMMNVQELETITNHNLQIGVVVLNNQGYRSIRQTQAEFAGGRYYGATTDGGLSIPSISSLGSAFKIPTRQVIDVSDLTAAMQWSRSTSGPTIIEVMGKVEQDIYPRTKFVKNIDGTSSPLPLSRMFPELGD